jgi:nuclear transport factor 2 (NTF2) superfamily protein
MRQADYFTKHHPTKHHQQIRSSYLYSSDDQSTNYFDCLQEESLSDSGEGVLKSKSPGGPSNPTPMDHNPNGYKWSHAESPNGEPSANMITHKFT